MRNLLKQRHIFGVLVTLVLAFSVQGVADALDEFKMIDSTEDLSTVSLGDKITLSFRVTLSDPDVREAFTVRVNGGGLNFQVGDSTVTSYTFREDDDDLSDDDNGDFSESEVGSDGDLSFTFSVQTHGRISISVTEVSTGVPTSERVAAITRVFYSVQIRVPETASIRLAGLTNGIKTGYFGVGPELVYNGDSSHYAVTYTIVPEVDAYIQDGSDTDRYETYMSGTRTSTAARLYLDTRTTSATVTAQVEGARSEHASVGVYVYNFPSLEEPVEVDPAASNGTAAPGQEITAAFTATVNDGADSVVGIPGVPVKFEVKDKTIGGGRLLPGSATIVDSRNRIVTDPKPGKTLYVRTNNSGEAAIGYEVGSVGREQIVTVSAVGDTQEVKAITNVPPHREISVHTNRKQPGAANRYDLIALVEDDGEPAPEGIEVSFNTVRGELTNTPKTGSADARKGRTVKDTTNADGQARVIYDAGDQTGFWEVVATVPATGTDVDTTAVRKIEVTFNSSGRVVQPQEQDQQQQGTGSNVLVLSQDSIRGFAGDEIALRATARDPDGRVVSNVDVTFALSETTTGSVSPTSATTNTSGVASTTITLPDDDAVITATATGYGSDSADITITARPSDLEAVSGNNQTGAPGSALSEPFVLRFVNSDDEPVSGALVSFSVESGGGSLSASSDTTDADGNAETTLTLGTSGTRNTVRASVDSDDYPGVSSITFTADAFLPAEAIIPANGDELTGQAGEALDEDLTVQVVDRDDNGVSGILVRFRITEGRGSLSRNSARTDSDGFAEIGFTPRSDGEIVVEAYGTDLQSAFFTIITGEPPDAIVQVSGNNQTGKPGSRLANPFVVEVIDANDDPVSGVTVNFAVTKGGGSVSPETATTNASGRASTRLTLGDAPGDNTVAARVTGLTAVTFKATSGSEVLVNAAQRAPMYWVSRADGKLHRLVGAEIENLAPNLTGVTDVAVDTENGLLYFSVQTGENRGAIRRANLNGRSVQTLKTLTAVPNSVAIDSAGGMVYWTNSRGRIQSLATEGSAKITNLAQSLPDPTAITLSNGFLYWGESLGRIRRINLDGNRSNIQNVATGLGEPLSISIAKGKVYWVERAAGGSGSLNRAGLDGSNPQQLKTFASGVPTSLAVDGSDNKIYWTKGAGKIQRSNLAGKFVRDIASGLVNPSSIALNVETVSPPVAQQQGQQGQQEQQETTPEADTSKYDVNGDGAVNNLDVTLVAVSLGSSNAAYDVNGDGEVDANDLREIIANTDEDAAAPALDMDIQALEIDFDQVQEQIELVLASDEMSISTRRTLMYLQHLLATARPSETALLANYPNPFNPETWIPYHLADTTAVRINIYDARGTLVRMLDLGHQTAGYYTSRSRAAYWDGRNALGERVASGIYFYQLETDKASPLRKMVILK